MKPNLKLLIAIRERGMRQKDFAKAVGEHHTFISRVINGWVNLDEARKARFAKALKMKKGKLFQ